MSRTLSSSASAASVSSHGDSLGLLLHILEELDGAGQLPAIDGLCGLAGVLEGNSQVGAASASRLRGLDLSGSVSNLKSRKFRRQPIVQDPDISPLLNMGISGVVRKEPVSKRSGKTVQRCIRGFACDESGCCD